MKQDIDKRRAIIKAARKILGTQGYQASTIRQVAAEAGVSRGLLHYYFRNKEEMLALAARDAVENTGRMAAEVFSNSRPGDDLPGDLVRSFRQLVRESPGYYHVFLEMHALSHLSETVARELKDLYRTIKDAVAAGLEISEDRGVIKLDQPASVLSMTLTGLFDGLGMQAAADTELADSEAFWKALEQGVRALLG